MYNQPLHQPSKKSLHEFPRRKPSCRRDPLPGRCMYHDGCFHTKTPQEVQHLEFQLSGRQLSGPADEFDRLYCEEKNGRAWGRISLEPKDVY